MPAGAAHGPVVVTGVPVALVRPLRQVVLRPGRPVEESEYPGDDHPLARHVAARLGHHGEVVSVGSLLPEAPPWPVPGLPDEARSGGGDARRIRGMATREGLRGRGWGRLVLDQLLEAAAAQGAMVVWCNARTGAVPFYRRAGFAAVGEPFDLAGIGEHLAMVRTLA